VQHLEFWFRLRVCSKSVLCSLDPVRNQFRSASVLQVTSNRAADRPRSGRLRGHARDDEDHSGRHGLPCGRGRRRHRSHRSGEARTTECHPHGYGSARDGRLRSDETSSRPAPVQIHDDHCLFGIQPLEVARQIDSRGLQRLPDKAIRFYQAQIRPLLINWFLS